MNVSLSPSSPLLGLPVETLQYIERFDPINQVFFGLRATNRALYAVFPLRNYSVLEKAIQGDLFSVIFTVALIRRLTEQKQIDEAREIVELFLQKAPIDVQEKFWHNFHRKEIKLAEKLFAKPYASISHLGFSDLCFSYELFDSSTKRLTEWFHFIVKVIAASPNCERIHILVRCQGKMPKELLEVILRCKSLKVLELPCMLLHDAKPVIAALSTHPSLEKVWVKVFYSPGILDELKKVCTILHGFELAQKQIDNVSCNLKPITFDSISPLSFSGELLQQVSAVFKQCTCLRYLKINTERSTYRFPPHLHYLNIVVPDGAYAQEVVDSLKQKSLASLRNLVVFLPENCEPVVASLLESIKNLPQLEWLTCHIPQEYRQKNRLFQTLGGKTILRFLDCAIDYNSHDLDDISTLCKQLESLHITIPENYPRDDLSAYPLNYESTLSQLALLATISGCRHPFEEIAPLVSACNPEELVIFDFLGPKGRTFDGLRMKIGRDEETHCVNIVVRGLSTNGLSLKKETYVLNSFPKLKRLIVCQNNFWECSKEVKPFVRKVYMQADNGTMCLGYYVDIERVFKGS